MNLQRLSPYLRFVRCCIPTIVVLLTLLGCTSSNNPTGLMGAAASAMPQPAETGETPEPTAATVTETPPPPPDYFPIRGDFVVSHILISHRTAKAAGKQIRTRRQAELLAEEIAMQLADSPTRFDDLARRHSDGAQAENGGRLGGVSRGDLLPELETVLANLSEGEVHSQPIESQFGYHFLRRDPAWAQHWAAIQFLVAKGDDAAQAQNLVNEIGEQLMVEPFEKVARQYSDMLVGPAHTGAFTADDHALPVVVTAAVRDLDEGAVTGPIEIEKGWLFLKRIPLQVRYGRHIVISYQDAALPLNGATRSREEAAALAEKLLDQLKAEPENSALFAELAQTHSDAQTRSRGGLFGPMLNGDLYYSVEAALKTLDEQQVTTKAVTTPVGFQILRREPPIKNGLP